MAPEPHPEGDRRSRVPSFLYASTLDEQQAQLEANPLLRRMRRSRRAKAGDPHRPAYHYVNPEGMLNDPNGLCFWQGRYHLFYQAYPPEDPRQHWGHAVSDDLVHWQDLPYAIYPDPEDRCFSGSTLVEEDRVIAIYHGVGAGTMVAVSKDPLLLNWEKVGGAAVIPFPAPGEPAVPYNIFDPCIWKRDGAYYALTAGTLPVGPGGKNLPADFLHRSEDLEHWEYLHPFVEDDRYSFVGDDGACPYFWPVGDRHILLYFSHYSGGRYLLGDYDTSRDVFVVTAGGRFNFGSVSPSGVHAPSAMPDGEGGVVAIHNMNPGKPCEGWNQLMTLPRLLTLRGRDELGIEPVDAVESLRCDHRSCGPLELPAGRRVDLDGVVGDALEIAAEVEPAADQTVELDVLRSPGGEERTRIVFYRDRGRRNREYGRHEPAGSLISIDSSRSSVLPDARFRAPETAPVFLGSDEPLRLRVFVDRSIVEVFVNDRQALAVRVFPGRGDSKGISLRSGGRDATVRSLDVWRMRSIWE